MRVILLALTLSVLLVVQLGLQGFGWVNSVPNLMLIYLCILLAARPVSEVWVTALLVGVVVDMLSGLPDGVLALAFPVSVGVAHYAGTVVFDRAHDYIVPIRVLVASCVFTVASLLAVLIIDLIFLNQVPNLVELAWPHSAVRIVYDVLFIVPVYGVYVAQTKILRYLGPKYESV